MTPEEIMRKNRKGLVKSKKTGKTGYVTRVNTSHHNNSDGKAESEEYSYWVIWSGEETPELVKGEDLIL